MIGRLTTLLGANQVFTSLFAFFFLTSFKKPFAQILIVLLVVGALYYFIKFRKKPFSCSLIFLETRHVFISSILMFLSVLPNMFLDNGFLFSLRSLNMPLVYVLGALGIFCLFNTYKQISLNPKWLFKSMLIATCINAFIACLQVSYHKIYHHSSYRADGFSTIVGFSTLSAIAGFGCFAYALGQENSKERYKYSLGIILAFLIVLLNDTRSALLAFMATFLAIVIWALVTDKNKKRLLAHVLVLLCVFGGIFALNKMLFVAEQSIDEKTQFQKDIELYEQKNDPNSSIGMRLARWKEAIEIFKMSPLIGMSIKTRCDKQAEIIERAKSYRDPSTVDCKEKYDNEFFNTLASQGLVGIIVLIYFLGSIFILFYKRLKDSLLSCSQDFSYVAINLMLLGMVIYYVVLCIGFDPFHFFIEGSFFVGMVLMGVLMRASSKR